MPRRTTRGCALLAAGLGLAAALPAAAQEEGAGPRVVGDALEIDIGGRLQTQLNTTSVEAEPASELLVRRARLEVQVKVNEVATLRIQPEFAGERVSVRDAYLRYDFHPAVSLLAGKAYRPFGLLEQTSSTRILPVERGADIRGVAALDEYELLNGLDYSDRDVGLQLIGAPEGAPLGLTYQAGVFRGPLHQQVGDRDSYQVAARLAVRPHERLGIGAAWSSRDFARSLGGDPDRLDLERGHAFEVDVEYGTFDGGLHLLAEAAWGDYNPFTGQEFTGVQGWLGYRAGAAGGPLSAVEPIVRVSRGDVDRRESAGGQPGTLLTPGLNLYFGGRNRIMLNYDHWSPDGDAGAEGSFKAQFQVAF